MNRFRTSAILFSLALLMPITINADTAPTISVTDKCTVTDTDGNSHVYSGQFLGICALADAKDQGAVSSYTLQNFSFGLFLQSLNGTLPGATEFWALYHNGVEASVGLTDIVVVQNDVLKFQLTDWSLNTTIGLPVAFGIGSLVSTTNAPAPSQSGGGEYLKGRPFDVSSALSFLAKKQNGDGSFSSSILTDWAAIAFGAVDDSACDDTCSAARQKLRLHLFSTKPELSKVTDYERHAMALMALGINPYVETKIDYITPIVAAFDGTQIGDVHQDNDDIFAIFPLAHAGYRATNDVIQKTIAFIVKAQTANGSWDESVDMTAAAIQALGLFPEQSGGKEAIEKAREYLRRNQNESGIFGLNSFSLSWVLQAIQTLGETPQNWKKSGVTPLGYLGVLQQEDGGVEPMSISADMRVWATSYAIPAAIGKPWDDILGDFARPAPNKLNATSYNAVATTSPSESAPKSPVNVSSNYVTSETSPISPELVPTTTGATTTRQVASVVTAENSNNGIRIWFSGLFLILGATFFFLRRLSDK